MDAWPDTRVVNDIIIANPGHDPVYYSRFTGDGDMTAQADVGAGNLE